RDDEAQLLRRASDRLAERQPRLAERQVECRRLDSPAAVLALSGLEQRERLERVLAGERQLALVGLEGPLRVRVVVDLLAAPLLAAPVQDDERQLALVGLEGPLRVRVVVDLLAAPLLAAPVQDDDRALQGELPRDLALQRLEIVAVDVQRQMADGVVEAHQ